MYKSATVLAVIIWILVILGLWKAGELVFAQTVTTTAGVPLTEFNYETTRALFETDAEFYQHIKGV